MWYEQVHSEPVPAWFMVVMQRHSHPFASLAVTFKSYLGAAPTAFCHSCTWRSLREHDLFTPLKRKPPIGIIVQCWKWWEWHEITDTSSTPIKQNEKAHGSYNAFPGESTLHLGERRNHPFAPVLNPLQSHSAWWVWYQLFLCSDWREERERLRDSVSETQSQRLRETQRDSERLRETQRDSERLREAQRDSERLREAQRGSERLREAQRGLRETQRGSEERERERETCVFNVVCGDCSGLSQKQDYVQSTTSRPQRLCQQRTPANSQSTLNSWMAGMWCLACL